MRFYKKITLLLVIIFSSCTAQEGSNKDLEVRYLAQTRGSSIDITFKNGNIHYKTSLKDETIVLSKEQQKEIREVVGVLNLKEISGLKAPSEKRFTDGALSANFTIKLDSNVFISSDFDHENPPKVLIPLYHLLQKIIKKG